MHATRLFLTPVYVACIRVIPARFRQHQVQTGKMSADSDPEAQSLCAHCRGLSLENLKPYLNGPGNAQSTGYVLHHTSAELEASARCCALCALIEKSLFQALERSQSACGLSGSEDLGLRTSAIVVEPKADSIGKAFPHPPAEGVYLSGLVVKAQHSVGETLIPLRGKVRLYLDGGGMFNFTQSMSWMSKDFRTRLSCEK